MFNLLPVYLISSASYEGDLTYEQGHWGLKTSSYLSRLQSVFSPERCTPSDALSKWESIAQVTYSKSGVTM